MNFLRWSSAILSLTLLVTGFQIPLGLASAVDGTIDPNTVGNRYAWSDNGGWVNFGTGVGAGDIHITEAMGITGYAWVANYGWINMAPAGSGVQVATDGQLSGQAWGENTGYINFGGVTIQPDGFFTGTATGAVVGTITFDCTNCAVETDYRPSGTLGGGSYTRSRLGIGSEVDEESGGGGELGEEEGILRASAEVPDVDLDGEDDADSSSPAGRGIDRDRFQNEGAVDPSALLVGQEAGALSPSQVPDLFAADLSCGDLLQDVKSDPEEAAIRFLSDAAFFLCQDPYFEPRGYVTRADAIKLNALGMGIDGSDIGPGDEWWSAWERGLRERGVIERDFDPTRYEPKADFLALVLKAKGYDLSVLEPCGEWFCAVVNVAQELGWVEDDVMDRPYALATRSWAAGVIFRAFFQYPFGQ